MFFSYYQPGFSVALPCPCSQALCTAHNKSQEDFWEPQSLQEELETLSTKLEQAVYAYCLSHRTALFTRTMEVVCEVLSSVKALVVSPALNVFGLLLRCINNITILILDNGDDPTAFLQKELSFALQTLNPSAKFAAPCIPTVLLELALTSCNECSCVIVHAVRLLFTIVWLETTQGSTDSALLDKYITRLEILIGNMEVKLKDFAVADNVIVDSTNEQDDSWTWDDDDDRRICSSETPALLFRRCTRLPRKIAGSYRRALTHAIAVVRYITASLVVQRLCHQNVEQSDIQIEVQRQAKMAVQNITKTLNVLGKESYQCLYLIGVAQLLSCDIADAYNTLLRCRKASRCLLTSSAFSSYYENAVNVLLGDCLLALKKPQSALVYFDRTVGAEIERTLKKRENEQSKSQCKLKPSRNINTIWNQDHSFYYAAVWGRCKAYAAIGTEEAMVSEIQALRELVQSQLQSLEESDDHYLNDTSLIPTLLPIMRRDEADPPQRKIAWNQILRLATLLEETGQVNDALMYSKAGLDRLVIYIRNLPQPSLSHKLHVTARNLLLIYARLSRPLDITAIPNTSSKSDPPDMSPLLYESLLLHNPYDPELWLEAGHLFRKDQYDQAEIAYKWAAACAEQIVLHQVFTEEWEEGTERHDAEVWNWSWLESVGECTEQVPKEKPKLVRKRKRETEEEDCSKNLVTVMSDAEPMESDIPLIRIRRLLLDLTRNATEMQLDRNVPTQKEGMDLVCSMWRRQIREPINGPLEREDMNIVEEKALRIMTEANRYRSQTLNLLGRRGEAERAMRMAEMTEIS